MRKQRSVSLCAWAPDDARHRQEYLLFVWLDGCLSEKWTKEGPDINIRCKLCWVRISCSRVNPRRLLVTAQRSCPEDSEDSTQHTLSWFCWKSRASVPFVLKDLSGWRPLPFRWVTTMRSEPPMRSAGRLSPGSEINIHKSYRGMTQQSYSASSVKFPLKTAWYAKYMSGKTIGKFTVCSLLTQPRQTCTIFLIPPLHKQTAGNTFRTDFLKLK